MRHVIKRIAGIILLSIIALGYINAQEQKDIIKFLDIPVDGTKARFGQKLVEKGFIRHFKNNDSYYTGKFNGQNVEIHLVDNHGKLYRVFIADDFVSNESEVKNRFNVLCRQFSESVKYVDYGSVLGETQEIPEEEDLSYEMSVHAKTYQAAYYQVDTLVTQRMLENYLGQNYKDKDLEDNETYLYAVTEALLTEILPHLENKCVWFKIVHSDWGKYRIVMYYDNVFNSPNGEDL